MAPLDIGRMTAEEVAAEARELEDRRKAAPERFDLRDATRLDMLQDALRTFRRVSVGGDAFATGHTARAMMCGLWPTAGFTLEQEREWTLYCRDSLAYKELRYWQSRVQMDVARGEGGDLMADSERLLAVESNMIGVCREWLREHGVET